MISIKLVAGKVTFIHRRLWPALVCVAQSRTAWQCTKPAAQALLEAIESADLRSDQLGDIVEGKPGPIVGELEKRLLVHAHQIHTERGAHAKVLESWERFAARQKVAPLGPLAAAYGVLEAAADGLDPDGAPTKLPWR